MNVSMRGRAPDQTGRGSVVLANFTSSGILDTPFQSNIKCDVIIRKNLSQNDVLSTRNQTYELPDRNIISLGAERFVAREFFQPVSLAFKPADPRHFSPEQHEV